MNGRPTLEEKYERGDEIINYVVYSSTTGAGKDEVLQHKLFGKVETAHVTLHPDGKVNFRVKRTRTHLENAIRSSLVGFCPSPSNNVRQFIFKVKDKIGK
jgi:hypothetical protein